MLEVLEHRGPNGSGIFAEGPVVLGNRRLAILDLTDAGAQPMSDSSERYVITYNGEIYNYLELRSELERCGTVFRSQSDTEVCLAAYVKWGDECLQRFNGMFAFAIYDRLERVLFCARDRLGVKPLVYAWNGRCFAFASEPKALLAARAVGSEVSSEAIYEYVARGYTTAGRSFYADVQVLPPGCLLRIGQSGEIEPSQWWRPATSPVMDRSSADWANRVAELLDDAVRIRLRSDVPVGAHLSGGLDSSAVVSAAARNARTEIVTFTGAIRGDRQSDEREFSRAVNAMCGLRAYEVEIDLDELAAAFDRILWCMDEPTAGPGAFPQLAVCDLAQRHGVKVVLGGQGGDELFGGYLRHRVLHHKSVLRHGSIRERGAAGLGLIRLALREGRRVRRTATRVTDERLAPSFLASVDAEFREEVRRSPLRMNSAADLMLWDLRNYLPALLQVEDRTSMAASIESRTPLLDYRLVELVLTIPENDRLGLGSPKPLLRQAVSSWLPAVVINRRDKRGFPTPLHLWKQRPALRGLVEELTMSRGVTGRRESEPSGPARRDQAPVIFRDSYLRRVDSFTPNELWTVMMIQGWTTRLGARSPADAGTRATPERVL